MSHSSAFLYAPLLLLPVVEAYRSGDRRLALFSLLAFGALLVATGWEADSAAVIYAWRVCHFSDPLGNVVHAITGAVAGQD